MVDAKSVYTEALPHLSGRQGLTGHATTTRFASASGDRGGQWGVMRRMSLRSVV